MLGRMELIPQPPSLEKRRGLVINDVHEGKVSLSWPGLCRGRREEGDLGGEFDPARGQKFSSP